MANEKETFFTVVGCMDGRIQGPIAKLGRQEFGAEYPDTITEAGIVGIIANNPSKEFLDDLQMKVDAVSIEKHKSSGVIVNGHEGCAGNVVDDEQHKEDIRNSVQVIEDLIGNKVPVIGVFVRNGENGWVAEKI